MLSQLISVTLGASLVLAAVEGDNGPLWLQRFTFGNLPEKVDPVGVPNGRGPQTGYTRCDNSTEGPDSLCQTAFINSLDSFCLWAPPTPGSPVGDVEGEAVAWCSKPGMGGRVFPPGTITGVQFIKTPHYIQVTGTINQEAINMQSNDSGGEMDPHGADGRGNPIGGLVFSNSFGAGPDSPYRQVVDWTNFMGDNSFCLKACSPDWNGAEEMCEHRYDRMGCAYNAPGKYEAGTFESCLGDDQVVPGVYVDSKGQTQKFEQGYVGELKIPYPAPPAPASSACTAIPSSDLFAAGTYVPPRPTITPTATSTTPGTPSKTSSPSPVPVVSSRSILAPTRSTNTPGSKATSATPKEAAASRFEVSISALLACALGFAVLLC